MVNIDNDTALDMLMDRVETWREKGSVDYDLFEQMYENSIDQGIFEGGNFFVDEIVDNDVVNWCNSYNKEDMSEEDWAKIEEAWNSGDRDISCIDFEFGSPSFIEAKIDDDILIRY